MTDLFDKFSDHDELKRLKREQAEREYRSAVDRLIDEAQREGKFDDLPGQGKPLRLKKNPYAQEKALAFELLQNNNYTLPWIARRNELLAKIDGFRTDLQQAWRRHQRRLSGTSPPSERAAARDQWEEIVAEHAAIVEKLNKEIADLNLTVPAERLELLKLNLDRELLRAGAGRASD